MAVDCLTLSKCTTHVLGLRERAPLARVRAGEDDPHCRTCGGTLKSSAGGYLAGPGHRRARHQPLGEQLDAGSNACGSRTSFRRASAVRNDCATELVTFEPTTGVELE
jgi:hypothetical protein